MVRISQNYFPRVVKAYEEELARSQEQQQSTTTTPTTTSEEEEVWPHQTRNKVSFALPDNFP